MLTHSYLHSLNPQTPLHYHVLQSVDQQISIKPFNSVNIPILIIIITALHANYNLFIKKKK